MSFKLKAFTVIEILLSIGIIGILIAITLPALSNIRRSATENKSLTNMRTHSTVLELYTADNKDFFPYLTNPDAHRTILRGGGITVESRFFGINEFWFIGLTDTYYSSSVDTNLFAYPGQGGGIYIYSSALFTSHDYWNETTRDSLTTNQWRAAKVNQVRYPSMKATFTESREREDATVYPIWSNTGNVVRGDKFGFGFTDGSASRFSPGSIELPFPTGDGGGAQSRYSEIGIAGVHTVDGVLGRDVSQ